MIHCTHVFVVISKLHARLMIRLSYQPWYMPFIARIFLVLLAMNAGSWLLRGERARGGDGVGEGFWWAMALRSGLGSDADSRMAHLTLSPHISWSPCTAGGRYLLPPPSLSSQPTRA